MRTLHIVVVVIVFTQDWFNSGCEWLLLAFFSRSLLFVAFPFAYNNFENRIYHCDSLQEYLAPIELEPDYVTIT